MNFSEFEHSARSVSARICSFVRKEIVFCVAFLCAVVSAFFVPPSARYLDYIDWDTLFILFALMGVVAALRACGVFDSLARFLCGKVNSVRGLCTLLVMLCFFSSMLITNDVALLTFVPFSLALLGPSAGGGTVMLAVVLETIAANTGSMLTPVGNPQNLFLFSKLGGSVADFMRLILPYSAASLVLLFASMIFFPKKSLARHDDSVAQGFSRGKIFREAVYATLFVLCLFSVAKIVPKPVSAVAVLFALIFFDRSVLISIDYMLLLTFAAFFVFTGNIASIQNVRDFLQNAVAGNEFVSGVAVSQVISNVPAALLLYPFADNAESLLIGVNVGGLGTLVASLASLISFKLYSASKEELGLPSAARYLAIFTAANVLGIAALCAVRIFVVAFGL